MTNSDLVSFGVDSSRLWTLEDGADGCRFGVQADQWAMIF